MNVNGSADFNTLLTHEGAEGHFAYIDPPFNFNAPGVVKYTPEVTGRFLLNSLCRRLGWGSLAGRKLLDFGCGVRFARTIVNLAIEIELYAGVDANAEAISWLQSEVRDPRLRFEHLDMLNPLYHESGGAAVDAGALQGRGLTGFDAACMFSVVTHQMPQDSALIFAMLYRCVEPGGRLYFTAFTDETVADYIERDPSRPGLLSTYHPDFLVELVRDSGWCVERTYLPAQFQQSAFVCRKPPTD
jgi:SAM-dependent methyltransferase